MHYVRAVFITQPAVRLGEHRIEDRSVEEGSHQRMVHDSLHGGPRLSEHTVDLL
jgi:hypothetical protein